MSRQNVHTLIVTFKSRQDLIDWASRNLSPGLAVYHGDGLDPEFTGHVPKNSYVVRRRGEQRISGEVTK